MKTKISLLVIILSYCIPGFSQWSEESLYKGRGFLSVASIGNKVYFAGGFPCNLNHTDIVEIYNTETCEWQDHLYLSSKKIAAAGVMCGNKVMFGGGVNDFYTGLYNNQIEIFDPDTNVKKVKYLSVPRIPIAVSNDRKVIFAGGLMGGFFPNYLTSDVVDILDIETGKWTRANLSMARMGMSATVVGDLAFFAGGYTGTDFEVTNRVDIYNFETGEWTIDSLSEARGWSTAATVGNKALFAGGSINTNKRTDVVDIYDMETDCWSTAQLSVPRSFYNPHAPTMGGRAFFTGGGDLHFDYLSWYNSTKNVDVYDGETEEWWVTHMKYGRTTHVVAATKEEVIVAGGSDCMKSVEIFKWPTSGLERQPDFEIFPNPTTGFLYIKTPNIGFIEDITVYDQKGRKMMKVCGSADKIDLSMLESGMYFIVFSAGKEKIIKKIFKL